MDILIPNVRFNLKTHDKEKDKNRPILIVAIFRFKENEKSTRLNFSTGVKCIPKYWDGSRMRLKVTKNHKEYSVYNQTLDRIELIIKNFYLENQGKISLYSLKQELALKLGKKQPKKAGQKSFMAFLDQYIEEKTKKEYAGNRTCSALRIHLKKFGELYGNEVDYKTFDWEFKENFTKYLFQQDLEAIYVSCLFAAIRMVLRAAHRRNLHSNLIFDQIGFGTKKIKKQHLALTLKELELFQKPVLSQCRENARDRFLISAYTGLRYSDCMKLKKEHFIKSDGQELIEIFNKKTGAYVSIPVFPQLKRIFEKYEYTIPAQMNHASMNLYVKEIGKKAGLTDLVPVKYTHYGVVKEKMVPKYKRISTHTARRSFATFMYYELDFPVSMIMPITGHKTESQFMDYIHIAGRSNAKKMATLIHEKMAKLNK